MSVNIDALDLMKYVTIYRNVYSEPEVLKHAIDNAPAGPGYILREYNPWEDQPGLRRQCLHEYYSPEKQSQLDMGIIGGEIFKDLSSRYPEDKIMPDDIAYRPVVNLLETYQAMQDDYLARWGININIIQYAPMELRYYEPQGVGPHSDYEGFLHLHPNGVNQTIRENTPNQSFVLNIYLNNDYGDGGEFFITRYTKKDDGTYTNEDSPVESYKFSPGDAVIFPCSFPYEHWVSEFHQGKRYMVNLNAIEDRPPTWQFE